jgi:CubicO group peptidase (beta-lactamase class C family)
LFAYTNVGATLAAAALETATGMSFNAFATRHILEPLGMDASGWSFSDIDLEAHSTLYANIDTPLPYYSLITYPDGGLICSPEDLSKYLRELIKGYSGEGTLLSKEGYRELFRPQLDASHLPDRDTENDFDDEYNSGIFMGFTPKDYVGHTGGDPGIATFMFFNPQTHSGRLLMINTSIVSQEGVDQFFGIWNTLIDYESRLNELTTNK